MKRLWIISELFYPNESATAFILTEMAKFFSQKYEVNVICADTNYENDTKRITDDSSTANLAEEGINIYRVQLPELDKNNIFKRLIRFMTVSRKLYNKAKELVAPGDIVFAVTNPAFLLPYLRRLKISKKVEYILLVHDVFPENAFEVGMLKSNFLYKMLKRYFDKAYAAADKILVLGEDMKERIGEKIGRTDNINICENWGASDIKHVERKENGKVVLQFAGNLGRVQGLPQLMDIILKLHNDSLVFDFWGSGAMVPTLNEFKSQHHLDNIRIRGSYSRSTQIEVLNDCDIAIVCLAKGMKGLGVPSKTYNILASGHPILYIGDKGSEIYNLVESENIGIAYDWEHISDLIAWLDNLKVEDMNELKEKGKRARTCFERFYTQEIILNKTLAIIDKPVAN